MVSRPAGSYVPPNKQVAKLLDRITSTLRAYLDQGGTRTDLVRAAGNDIAKLRSLFTRNDAPDWSGRSNAYKQAMSEVYSRLNVTGARRESLQFTVRFHAGNAIREMAEAEELEAAGLDAASPRDRLQLRRDANEATAQAVGIQSGTAESLPKALAWAATLLEFAETLDATALTAEERDAARELCIDLTASLKTLRARLRAR